MRGSAEQLAIVHADPAFVVVDKPAGMLSVPGRGPDKTDCVPAVLRQMFPHATGPMTVHRLDMDTSGLMVVALSTYAQRYLSVQFERRRVEKSYCALVEGVVHRDFGTIDLPIRPDWPNRPRQMVCPERGKASRTAYRVLTIETDRTRLELTPITGRTHQLRVHLAHEMGLGRPIIGDPLYGRGLESGPRLMLHATRLSFRPPGRRRMTDFFCPPPF